MLGVCQECGRERHKIKKGLCPACYERQWRKLHPEEIRARAKRAYQKQGHKPHGSVEERFYTKVDKNGANGCWVWMGAKDRKGYGSFNAHGKTQKAHRVSYEMHKGSIPEGMQVDHLCRNPSCVNPDHLEAVTPYENFLRGTKGSAGGRLSVLKTHCPREHEYTPENTYRHGNHRYCKACHRKPYRKYKTSAQPLQG